MQPPQVPQEPRFDELVRVIPIAQTQREDKVAVTLPELEVYADGCLLTILVQIMSYTPHSGELSSELSWFTFTMTDDRGTSYTGTLHAIRSRTIGDLWQGRGECWCVPTLQPAARTLRIAIPELRWERREYLPEGGVKRVPSETTYGPQIFSVNLPLP